MADFEALFFCISGISFIVIGCPQAGRALTFTLDAKVSKTSRQKNAPTAQTQVLPRFFANPTLLFFQNNISMRPVNLF